MVDVTMFTDVTCLYQWYHDQNTTPTHVKCQSGLNCLVYYPQLLLQQHETNCIYNTLVEIWCYVMQQGFDFEHLSWTVYVMRVIFCNPKCQGGVDFTSHWSLDSRKLNIFNRNGPAASDIPLIPRIPIEVPKFGMGLGGHFLVVRNPPWNVNKVGAHKM